MKIKANKINIVGSSAMGKSTLGKQLADILTLPYIEMDALFWLPNWQMRPQDEFIARVEQAIQPDGWILDGNYHATSSLKWQHADMVIWLDYGFGRNMQQAVKRALQRIKNKQELWPGTGNRETFKQTFLSKDSILLWTLRTHHKNRKRYLACMKKPEYQHIQWVRLRSPKQTAAFVEHLRQV